MFLFGNSFKIIILITTDLKISVGELLAKFRMQGFTRHLIKIKAYNVRRMYLFASSRFHSRFTQLATNHAKYSQDPHIVAPRFLTTHVICDPTKQQKHKVHLSRLLQTDDKSIWLVETHVVCSMGCITRFQVYLKCRHLIHSIMIYHMYRLPFSNVPKVADSLTHYFQFNRRAQIVDGPFYVDKECCNECLISPSDVTI